MMKRAKQVNIFTNKLALNEEVYDTNTPEIIQFHEFIRDFAIPRRWKPFRTEWSIFEEESQVAGQIDCVFKTDDKEEYHMVDWKRTEKDLTSSAGARFNRYGIGPCQGILDNNFNKYMVQQNLYSCILSKRYGIELSSMWLVQIHPRRNGYTCMPVPRER